MQYTLLTKVDVNFPADAVEDLAMLSAFVSCVLSKSHNKFSHRQQTEGH